MVLLCYFVANPLCGCGSPPPNCFHRLLACLDIYPNINRIQYVKCPVMVIHGKQDEEVHFHHGVEMHRAVPPQYQRDPWWVPDRGHNDITEGQGKLGEYIRRLRRFMETMEEE